jgi:hypothetical protein
MSDISILGRSFVSVEAIQNGPGDCIPDVTMGEVARRLLIKVDKNAVADIIRSEEQPTDITKIWFQPSTKQAYSWSASEDKWVETNIGESPCLAGKMKNLIKRDEAGCLYVVISNDGDNLLELDEEGNITLKRHLKVERFDLTVVADVSGNATRDIAYTLFEDAVAAINVMPREKPPEAFRWWVDSQDEGTAKVKFSGMGASASLDLSIIAHQTEFEDL